MIKSLALLFVCIVVTGLILFGVINVLIFMNSKSEIIGTEAAQVNEKIDVVNSEGYNVEKAIHKMNNSLSNKMDSYKQEYSP
ncbi:hypothetical protein M3592_26990 [Priestia aryabhattai]|uniref:hypothetical protein n=1 Tax=Priestia TaxID=2800373 RepID=UPI00203C3393|nr:hypothetical protein [Priestia aryabhattai]MCM2979052.1 hypothetical protein [Priestia aryabhattai]